MVKTRQPPRNGSKRARLSFIKKPTGLMGAKDLPLFVLNAGTRARGRTGKTERPDYLVGVEDAYALEVKGRDMAPAFEPGWLVYVNPGERVRVGTNVVAKTAGGRLMIRRLVRKTRSFLVLRQFNPLRDAQIAASEVTALHRIAGVRYRR